MKPTGPTPAAAPTARPIARIQAGAPGQVLDVPATSTGRGVLSVKASSRSAVIWIDGEAYGAPPREFSVESGRYEVQVRLGGSTRSRQVKVRAGTRETWRAVLGPN